MAEAFAVAGPTSAPETSLGSVRLSGAILSHRERDVFHLLVAGKTDREIADALYISPSTDSRDVDNLSRKLDLDSRATAYAVRQGLS